MSSKNVGPDGLVVVDKPGGWTSHDVVARVRRLAGTRRVGHAGTLDPMATGVLVLGVNRATRLLGHLAATDKAYDATIRLGQSTLTDDAEGEVVGGAPAGHLTYDDIVAAAAPLTGEIEQVPSKVSAVKVDGRRAYARVRAGEDVELAARPVVVSRFDVLSVRPAPLVSAGPSPGSSPGPSPSVGLVDVDVRVECSSGTYVRALARDLGSALGVGGHLTRLRRTRVGRLLEAEARSLDQLEERFVVIPLAAAVAAAFPHVQVDAADAGRVRHGSPLPTSGTGPGPVGIFGPGGELLALGEERDGQLRYLAVLAAPEAVAR